MKKIISFFIVCMLLCVNVFAEDSYTVINMSEFSNADNFAEGLCAVQDSVSKRWGFVDVNKNWVISPIYKHASYFKNGLCAVNTVDGEVVLINRNGETIFKRNEYEAGVESDNFYLEKHGKYNMIFDGNSYYHVTLLNENYDNILTDVSLRTFDSNAMDLCKTMFWEENQEKIYNYMGLDITEKLISENINISVDMPVNNKYIVGQADGKIKCFDIHGNKVAEFNNDGKISLCGNLVVCNNKVHNILYNKTIFENTSIDVEKIETYYNKFFTVKKKNGTSALYSAKGELLVDFGKWDNIYPSSVSNNIVIAINGKYGVADYNGNLLLPLDYKIESFFVSNQNPTLYSQLSNSGRYATFLKDKSKITVNLSTLKCFDNLNSTFIVGNKYHKSGGKILDNNLNIVYSDKSIDYIGGYDTIDNGIMKQLVSGKFSGFVVFNGGGIKVEIDNTRLTFDVLPVIQNGRTLVPMRAIFEALGADVEWNGDTQTITAKNKDVTIQMQIGNNTLTKNGQSTQMDVSPMLVDGRTMVPVRAVSDSFNVAVDWNGYTQTVSLFTN